MTEPASSPDEAWSDWLPFPNPRKGSLLVAPIGPRAFEIRQVSTQQALMLATANSVSGRMSGLLPADMKRVRCDYRSRRQYLVGHVDDLQYRVMSAVSRGEAARVLAPTLRRDDYRFGVDL